MYLLLHRIAFTDLPIRGFSLQDRLPGMPDTTRLAAEAEAANNVVRDDITKQVEHAVQDCAVKSRH